MSFWYVSLIFFVFFFFFQAEDGIRDVAVTGVQTCALPILDAQAVQSGSVVATGPGTPISAPTELGDEPWKMGGSVGEPRYLPVQAEPGDHAIFFRRAAVEITFRDEKYLVVPQAAILALVRDDFGLDID